MRYHYGLGVGHSYAHNSTGDINEHGAPADLQTSDSEEEEVDMSHANTGHEEDSDEDSLEDPSSSDSHDDETDFDDEELLAMEEMYGMYGR
jgi:hypothetical protein